VNDLFLTVVDQLCRAFNCTVNFLPQMLEECWGRVLTEHGHAVDTQIVPVGAMPTVAKYLDRAAAECYRISFRSGLAYVRALPNFYSWVLANSSAVGWTDGRGKKAPQMMFPGYAGFALSMDRRMYMAHHRGSFNQDNFFHSSYLSGDAVLCTGTILIENGVVKAIANDSGHYQPTLEHLVNVIRTLQMHGANISKLEVYAAPYSWRDNTGTVQKQWGSFWATDVLTTRGSGGALYQRMQANQNNIKSRGGSPQSPVVTLPTRQLPPPPPPRF
jgi:hypothetical protein